MRGVLIPGVCSLQGIGNFCSAALHTLKGSIAHSVFILVFQTWTICLFLLVTPISHARSLLVWLARFLSAYLFQLSRFGSFFIPFFP
jgi:hypothetical protein